MIHISDITLKKATLLFVVIMVMASFVGCNSESSMKNAKIFYGQSQIYSKEDIDKAIEEIKKVFTTWDGLEMDTIGYTSDEICSEEYKSEGIKGSYDQCIVLESDFHTKKYSASKENEYTGYEWILARKNGGDWIFIDCGYE